MIAVKEYIEPLRITTDAIEGFAVSKKRPYPNELCTYSFLKRVEVFRCVYVTLMNDGKYAIRFERANWK